MKYSSKRAMRSLLLTCGLVLASFGGVAANAGGLQESDSHVAEARRYIDSEQYRAAFIELRNALQANSTNIDATLLMAQVRILSGQGVAAQTDIERARTLGANRAATAVMLARAYLLQRLPDAALAEIESVTIPDIDRADELLIRGDIAVQVGRPDEAEGYLVQAEQIAPNYHLPKMALARLALSRRDFDLAIRKIDEAAAMSPGASAPMYLKGMILRGMQDKEGAVAHLNSALERNPEFMLARLERAAAFIDLGRMDQARSDIDVIYTANPENPMAHYLSAVIAVNERDFSTAQDLLTRTGQALNDFLPALLLKGITAYQLANFEQAGLHLSRLVNEQPNNGAARRAYGATLLKLSDPLAAAEILLPAVEAGDTSVATVTLLGSAYLQAGKYEEATRYLEMAAALAPNSEAVRTQLALGRLATGEAGQAITELVAVVDANPDSLRALVMLALFERQQGNLDVAIGYTEKVVAAAPDNPLGHNIRGGILTQQGKYDDARGAFNRALELDPNFRTARQNLGQLARIEGDLEEAVLQFQLILEAERANVPAMKGMMEVAVAQDDLEEALLWADRASQAQPDDASLRIALVRRQLAVGDPEAALGTALKADSDFSEDLRITALLGTLYMASGEFDGAANAFDRWVRRDPENLRARQLLGRSQWKSGRIEAARSTYGLALAEAGDDNLELLVDLISMETEQKRYNVALGYALDLRALHPGTVVAETSMGNLYMRSERFAEAEQAFLAAIEIEDTIGARYGLSQNYMQMGRAEDAIATLEEWIDKNGRDPQLASALANTYLLAGRFDEAAEEFLQVIEENPGDVQFVNNLAFAYHKIGDARASEVAEEAYRIAPDSPDVADTLGWILVETGQDIRRGLLLLQDAYGQRSTDSAILYHLGAALIENDRAGEARQFLERALAIDNNFRDADATRRLLDGLD